LQHTKNNTRWSGGTNAKNKKEGKKCKCNKMITWFFFILSNITLGVGTASFKISPPPLDGAEKTNQIESAN
jgi:hypothetical protein